MGSYDRWAWRTTLVLNTDAPLTNVRTFLSDIQERDLVPCDTSAKLDLPGQSITITMAGPYSLEPAPSGTHDYAIGWLHLRTRQTLESLIRECQLTKGKIEWVQLEMGQRGYEEVKNA